MTRGLYEGFNAAGMSYAGVAAGCHYLFALFGCCAGIEAIYSFFHPQAREIMIPLDFALVLLPSTSQRNTFP